MGCAPAPQPPHFGVDPIYPLNGAHEDLPCEWCHGPGPQERISTSCLSCHASDVPDPSHNPGLECFPCHTPTTWREPDPTPPAPTTPAPVNDPNHVGYTTDQQCQDCHPQALDGTLPTDERHAPQPPSPQWDCGPCHTLLDWADATSPSIDPRHPVRTPHGTVHQQAPVSPDRWVIACADCHIVPGDLSKYDCVLCHGTLNDPELLTHPGTSPIPGQSMDAWCINCHKTGDVTIEQHP